MQRFSVLFAFALALFALCGNALATPVLTNAAVSPNAPTATGGAVTYSVNAADVSDGVSGVSVSLYQNGAAYHFYNLSNTSGTLYTNTFNLPTNNTASAINWKATFSATSKAGNTTTQDVNFVQAVDAGVALTNASVSPAAPTQGGGPVTLSVNAADVSDGVSSVTVSLYQNGAAYHFYNLSNTSGTLYSVTLNLPANSTTGAVGWKATFTGISKAGNSASVDVLFSQSQNAQFPPVAHNDNENTLLNTPVTFNALANDTDPNTPTILLDIAGFTQPAHGAVVKNADRTFTYTPAAGYLGSDGFSYTVTNGNFNATAQVAIKVRALTTIAGTVTLQDTSLQAQPVAFHFRSTDNGISSDVTMTPDAAGHFTITNVPAGTYSLGIKGVKWLQKAVPLDTTGGNVSGITASLLSGDANNDNSVDSSDFGLLIGAFNSQSSIAGSGYDSRADFNDDGSVDSTDFGILIGNFNTMGDN